MRLWCTHRETALCVLAQTDQKSLMMYSLAGYQIGGRSNFLILEAVSHGVGKCIMFSASHCCCINRLLRKPHQNQVIFLGCDLFFNFKILFILPYSVQYYIYLHILCDSHYDPAGRSVFAFYGPLIFKYILHKISLYLNLYLIRRVYFDMTLVQLN